MLKRRTIAALAVAVAVAGYVLVVEFAGPSRNTAVSQPDTVEAPSTPAAPRSPAVTAHASRAGLPSVGRRRPGSIQPPIAADGRTPKEIYAEQANYPPYSRPLSPSQVDLIDWNRRYDRPVESAVDPELSILLTADRYVVTSEAPVTLLLELKRGAELVDDAEVRAELGALGARGEDPAPESRVPIEFQRDHGRYVATLDPARALSLSSSAMVSVLAEIERAGGVDRARLSLRVTPAEAAPARFLGSANAGVEGGDLSVAVDVDVTVEGHYLVDANLWDAENRPVAWARFRGGLSAGVQTVELRFAGNAVLDRQPVLPLTVGELRGQLYRPRVLPDLVDMAPAEPIAIGNPDLSLLSSAPWSSPGKATRLEILAGQ